MTKGLSKFHHTAFCQCPKNLWLKVYKPNEAKAVRESLFRYCELDTWAMVKVWERLVVLAK